MLRLPRITVVLVALLVVTVAPSRAQNASNAHALQFDGSDDVVAIPTASELGGTPRDERSIEAWFKVDDATIDTRKQVIWEEGGVTNGFNVYVFDGALYVGAWSESNGFAGEWLQTSTIQNDTWHHVALVYDNTSGTFTGYLDGNAFGSVGVSNTIDSHGDDIAFGRMQKDTKFHDGDGTGDGHEFQGFIDEGRVWNTVRTQSQIQNNRFSTLSGNETGLAGYWPFEEGSGTTTSDLASGNDGTLNGVSWTSDTAPLSRIWLVDEEATGANDGTSWADAFTDLQDALAMATATDEIWIAEGTYTPTSGTDRSASFTVTGTQDRLGIFGGFAGGESDRSERNPSANPVVLSGDIGTSDDTSDNSFHVLFFDGTTGGTITTNTVLDGVTVTVGNANGSGTDNKGGGLLCDGNGSGNGCSPQIRNVTFSANAAANGGAIYSDGRNEGASTPQVTNVIFSGNTASSQGGAIYSDARSNGTNTLEITNVTFSGNSASDDGGAIYNQGTGGTSSLQFTNAILWDNSATDSGDEIFNNSGSSTLRHTLIEGGVNGPGVGGGSNNDGGNNLDADPLFFDPNDPDGADDTFATDDDGLRVLLGSPAIDAGDDNAVPGGVTTDITGAARIQDGTVDLGPYEGGVDLPPAAPTGLATTAGAAQVDLSWDANDESDLDGYNVYRSTSSFSDPANATKVNGSVVTGTSFTDTGLSNGTTYHYRITAVDDGANESALSGEATATPTDPSITYYVDGASGSDGNDGQSWGQAFATLQQALSVATDNDEIWIAEGTYHPDEGPGVTDDDRNARFTVTGDQNGLEIYGGFQNGDAFADRSPADHPVVLSGDIDQNDNTNADGVTETADDINGSNSFHVLLLDGTSTPVTTSTIIDGVTVSGGQAGNGDTTGSSIDDGGGLFCNGKGGTCNPVLRQIAFLGNTAERNGGAIYNDGSESFNGPAGESSPEITNATFSGNSASRGGAIYNEGTDGTSSPQITNSTFSGNTSGRDGGAIYNAADNRGTSSPAITNATITGNTASGDGGAIYNAAQEEGTSSPSITNTILHGNSATNSGDEIFNDSATPTLSHTLIEGGVNGPGVGGDPNTDGGNNLNADPLFVDSGDPDGADGNFATGDDGLRVRLGSPAIDVGDNGAVPSGVTIDITGAARIQDGTVDLGPYEGGVDLPPAAPTGLATTAGDAQVDLSWDANSESDLAGYNVYRATSSFGDPANATKVNGSIVTGTSFTDTGLSNGTTYHYRITAVDDGANESALSGEATATPTDPSVTYYVDGASGSDGNDGQSWGQAFATLQKALSVATGADEIWIAEGTYYPDEGPGVTDDDRDASFTVTGAQDGLKIYGGFANGDAFGDRSPADHPVALSGDIGGFREQSFTVLFFDGTTGGTISTNTVLDGVTVRLGRADDRNLPPGPDRRGGGLFCDGSGSGNACSPRIANVNFTNNFARRGAAIFNKGTNGTSSPTIVNCTFSGNSAVNQGGAIFNEGTDGTSSPQIVNSVFVDNSGNAIYNRADGGTSSPQIINTTFTSNGDGAIYNQQVSGGTSSPTITNTILYDNGSEEIVNDGATPTLRHTLVEGGCPSGADCGDGSTILDADPLFGDPTDLRGADGALATGDDGVRFASSSPALNAGDDAALPGGVTTDITGAARRQDGTVDLGAYEGGVAPTTYYVDGASGSDGNDGQSWDQAFATLRQALRAAFHFDEIWIAEGTYYPDERGGTDDDSRTRSFSVTGGQDGLKIYGGFQNGDAFADRSPADHPVVLSGDIDQNDDTNGNGANSHHVLWFDGGAGGSITTDTVLDGVTVTAGNDENNPGIGGGLLLEASGDACSPTIANVIFADNYARRGGAMGNMSPHDGGTINPTIVNATFIYNSADDGGALYNDGGLGGDAASPTIINVTFSGNSTSNQGGAIYNLSWQSLGGGTSNPTITNTILWGNSATNDGDEIFNARDATPTLSHTLIEGGVNGSGVGGDPNNDGGNNLDADPLFLDPSDPDGADDVFATDDDGLRVLLGSPAIDAGDDNAVPGGVTTDITGADRIQDGTVDLGAYEGGIDPALTLHVDHASGNDSNNGQSWGQAFATLQQALSVATDNDEIWIAEGTYYPDEGPGVTDDDRSASFTVTGDQNGLEIYGGFANGDVFNDRSPADHPVVLSGDIDQNDNTNADDVTETAGDINGSNSFHVLLLDGTSTPVTTSTIIDGVTVSGGQAGDGDSSIGEIVDNGGGLVCNGEGGTCNPVLRQIAFRGNAAEFVGGAIYNDGRGNAAEFVGGAIYNDGSESVNGPAGESSPEITNATFSGNSANRQGGAIYNNGFRGTSSPQIVKSTFSDNSSSFDGGAIYNNGRDGTSSPQIINSTFSGNSSSFDGGAIFNGGVSGTSSPSITNTSFTGNNASGRGGAIYNDASSFGPRSIANDARDARSSVSKTSGSTSSPTITNSTFFGNSASSGGAIFNDASSSAPAARRGKQDAGPGFNPTSNGTSTSSSTSNPTITNTILHGNSATNSGDEIFNDSATPTLRHTLIEGGVNGSGVGGNDNTDGGNNLDADPLFLDPSDPDGDDDTFATDDDGLHLQSGSPAIDAGDDSALPADAADLDGDGNTSEPIPHDVTGAVRSQDAAVDLGAYERAAPVGLTIDGTPGADGTDAGWRFIGLPTSVPINAGDLRLGGQAPLFDLPSGHMLQEWDDQQGTGTTGGYDPIESASETLQPGRGYAVFLFDQDPFALDPSMTIDVAGDPPPRGGQTVTINPLAQSAQWHLLANPYPTGYDLSSLTNLPGNGFQAAVQRYDATTDTWVVEDQSTTDLAAWQGFFIERTDPGGGTPGATTVSFNPAGRIAGVPFVGSKTEETGPDVRRARLALGLTVTAAGGDTLSRDAAAQVLFDARATADWDPWDASKLTPLATEYALVAPEGPGRGDTLVAKAVESRPWPSERQEIPLRLITEGTPDATATLSVREWALPDGWRARIVDTESGRKHILDSEATLDVALPPDTPRPTPRYELQVAPTGAPLPVELSAFEAAQGEDGVRLTWQTASETNNAGFAIQRRIHKASAGRPTGASDGRPTSTWEQVAFVEGAGTTSEPQTYRFTDTDLPFAADTLAYRLKQIDTDGTAHFSDAIAVGRSAVQAVQLHGSFPNPARAQATIRYALPRATDVRLEVYDLLGRRVMTLAEGRQEAGRKQLPLDASRLSSGTYFYRLAAGSVTKTRKLTVVR